MLCPPMDWIYAALSLSLSQFERDRTNKLRPVSFTSTTGLWLDSPNQIPAVALYIKPVSLQGSSLVSQNQEARWASEQEAPAKWSVQSQYK